MKPNRVYGVDFSGAKNADRKIWIAGGPFDGGTLRLDLCRRLTNLPGSGSRLERALTALCTFVREQAPCVVGMDFPFGLPHDLVDEERWKDFVFAFGDRYPDPDTFRAACQAVTDGKELKRVTDCEAGTPHSPYNLRIYKMTYYGIRGVLAPLVRSATVSVLPMQPAIQDRAWLLEICPASTLEQLGLRRSYKDAKGRALRSVRDAILTEVTHPLGIAVPDLIRRKVVADKDGDALDSIIAAIATFRALRESINPNNPGDPFLVEGRVYV